jgi:hypothetical protein
MGPDGIGDNSIVAFAPDRQRLASFVVRDVELSPLDLAVAPNGNVLISSEHPFAMADAVTTLHEYMPRMGIWCACFVRTGWQNFASRAVCGSDRKVTSTTSRRTR